MTQDMNTLETLMRARAVISQPQNWAGKPSELNTKNCMVTALNMVGSCTGRPAYRALIRAVGCEHGMVSAFNDSHSHAEVLAAYDRAIEAEWEKVQGASEPIIREAVVA